MRGEPLDLCTGRTPPSAGSSAKFQWSPAGGSSNPTSPFAEGWSGLQMSVLIACLGFPAGPESACQCRGPKRYRFSPWIKRIPSRRKWQPTLVFLPRKSHGWRSLEGYSPWGCKRVGHNLATKQQVYSTLSLHHCCCHLFKGKSRSKIFRYRIESNTISMHSCHLYNNNLKGRV